MYKSPGLPGSFGAISLRLPILPRYRPARTEISDLRLEQCLRVPQRLHIRLFKSPFQRFAFYQLNAISSSPVYPNYDGLNRPVLPPIHRQRPHPPQTSHRHGPHDAKPRDTPHPRYPRHPKQDMAPRRDDRPILRTEIFPRRTSHHRRHPPITPSQRHARRTGHLPRIPNHCLATSNRRSPCQRRAHLRAAMACRKGYNPANDRMRCRQLGINTVG